jgi:P27 family predicted phage terminase small subunit
MGKRGPPAKPTVLKLLAGNPGKRTISDREPKPPAGVPRYPDWLSAEARKVWRRLAPQLKTMKVLTLVDRDALAAYCHTYARWREAEDFITRHGLTYPIRDEKGNVRCLQQFPQVAIARNLLLVLRAYQQEFGLTPAARARVQVQNEPEEDRARGIIGW